MAKLTRRNYRKNCKKSGGTTKLHKKIKRKHRIKRANESFFKRMMAYIYIMLLKCLAVISMMDWTLK